MAAPAKCILTAPIGTIVKRQSITFIWSYVAEATWYYLWVNDSVGATVIQQWFKSSVVYPGSGSSCSATVKFSSTGGSYTWWVQTWKSSTENTWSDPAGFTITIPTYPNAPGACVLTSPSTVQVQGAITNFVWEHTPDATWYYLWVTGPAGDVVKNWFMTDDIISGITCTVPVQEKFPIGKYKWWVQSFNTGIAGGPQYGPWSTPMDFTVEAAYTVKEIATQRKPVEFYHIWTDAMDWYYTNSDISVVYNGKTYLPAVISRGTIEKDTQLNATKVNISFAYLENPVVEYLVENGVDLVWVSVIRAFRDQDPIEATVVFVGHIREITFKGIQGQVTCVGFEYFLSKMLPENRYSPQCNWKVFSERCGVQRSTFEQTCTVAQIQSDGLGFNWSGTGHTGNYDNGDLNWYRGGEAVRVYTFGDVQGYERRLIVGSQDYYIAIRFKMANLKVNETVILSPGCDGSITTCINKFDNFVHFRGFPYIPMDNPVAWIWA